MPVGLQYMAKKVAVAIHRKPAKRLIQTTLGVSFMSRSSW